MVLNFTVEVTKFNGDILHLQLAEFGFDVGEALKYGCGLWRGMSLKFGQI